MQDTTSTGGSKGSKPQKPRPNFPLFPHSNGQWAKKIRGDLHYFGLWADPQAALDKYLDEKDDLHAGRTPRKSADELMIRDVVNQFLDAKQQLVDSGEITSRTWSDYHSTCERITDRFGAKRLVDDLRGDDFSGMRAALAKRWGPVAVGNELQRVRTVFKYAYDAGLIDAPMRFGPGFKRPSKKVLRKSRQEKGPRMFEAAQLLEIIKAADQPLQAMIMLGVNAGFGNSDVGTLPIAALDLKTGWVDYPRPKTGIARRCPLWPETVVALRAALNERPDHKESSHAGLVFVTKYGGSWFKGGTDNPISKAMAKVLKSIKLQRPGLNFYALRHTFETIAGESKDQVAVDHIMGHARDDMASVYRERISDDRLKAVSAQVHTWLFGQT